jgi:hypothetical protein
MEQQSEGRCGADVPKSGEVAKNGEGPGGTIVVTERIVIEDGEVLEEIIEIEEYAKAGRTPHPRAKGYLIRVDKQKILFDRSKATGREILERAGKVPPKNYILRQVLRGGGLEKIELDETVDLARHGIEKFKTMLKTAQDGAP